MVACLAVHLGTLQSSRCGVIAVRLLAGVHPRRLKIMMIAMEHTQVALDFKQHSVVTMYASDWK